MLYWNYINIITFTVYVRVYYYYLYCMCQSVLLLLVLYVSGYLEKLELLLTENEALRADIPLQFRPVMTAALDRVDLAIRPGLITIGWSCLGVEPYFTNVTAALDQLRQLTKVVSQGYTIECGTSAAVYIILLVITFSC